eukprot:TRINITY_DN8793_c0_g1_i2.p1 TRINITY_DN8793_c0_g1~~TRINITY_DN8793_c0_g1_i2.p1  ORF type:complete len:163 (-),score=15.97 TRINITY_DN8793_c0_g1_i2:60-548(-)
MRSQYCWYYTIAFFSLQLLTFLALHLLTVSQAQHPPTDELQLIIMVFRHGARGSTGPPQGLAKWDHPREEELTQVGKRMLYLMGAEIRHRFIDDLPFLSKDAISSEVYVRSTPINRAIMSAENFLAGLYQSSNEPELPPGFPVRNLNSTYIPCTLRLSLIHI